MDIKEYIKSQEDIDTLAGQLAVMCGRTIMTNISEEELIYLILIKTAVVMDILTMQAEMKEKLDTVSLMDMTATILLGMMVKLNSDCNKSLRDIYREYTNK